MFPKRRSMAHRASAAWRGGIGRVGAHRKPGVMGGWRASGCEEPAWEEALSWLHVLFAAHGC